MIDYQYFRAKEKNNEKQVEFPFVNVSTQSVLKN